MPAMYDQFLQIGCNACNYFSLRYSFQQRLQYLLSGFYYSRFHNKCFKCSGIQGSNGQSNQKGCVCVNGEWNLPELKCVNITCGYYQQFNPQTSKCECSPLLNVFPIDGKCKRCLQFDGSTGLLIYNTTTDKYVCQCKKGYVFGLNQFQSFTCICEYPLVSDRNGGCYCDPIYSLKISDYECFLCSEGGSLISSAKNVNQSNPTVCSCQEGYEFKWNHLLKQGECMCPKGYKFAKNSQVICECDFEKSIQIYGHCIGCELIPFSNNLSNSDRTECGCIAQFIWNLTYNNCSCNSSTVLALESGKCIFCTQNILAVNRINGLTCNCLPNLFWNSRGYCDCGQTSALIINKTSYSCLQCSNINLALEKFNKTICTCLPSFIWVNSKCACPVNSFMIIVNNSRKCIVCNSTIFASAKNGANACSCVSSIFIWNSLLNSCICSSKYSIPFKSGKTFSCITCAPAINAVSRQSQFICNCINSTYIWIPEMGKCGCADLNSVLVNGSKCIICNSLVYAQSKYNATYCNCISNFLSWKPTGRCECDATAAFIDPDQFGNPSCIICNSSNLALSKYNSTACKCKIGFVWNGAKCVCPSGTIYTTNLACLDCKIAIKQKLDNYTCACSSSKFWDDIKKICVACGSSAIPNSTSNTFGNGIGCICSKEYIWDVMTNTCILPCPKNNYCMNCTKISNTVTTNFIVGIPQKYRELAGSRAIGKAYLSAATNYIQLNYLACDCANGFSWEPFRKRCYNSLTP